MRRLVLLPALRLTFVLAACGGAATPSPAATGAAGSPPAAATGGGGGAACAVAPAGSTGTVAVTIKDFKYAPTPIQAKVGDVITWTNQDSVPHSATLDNGACDTDSINNGASASLVFNTAGTYTYHCKVHPTQMKDQTIVVS